MERLLVQWYSQLSWTQQVPEQQQQQHSQLCQKQRAPEKEQQQEVQWQCEWLW